MKVLDIPMDELIQVHGVAESDKIYPFSSLVDEVNEFLAEGSKVRGDSLPWSKTHDFVGLGEGELSVWAGINGHGKTQILSQVMANLLPHRKVLIASMEMQPKVIISMMARQVAGCSPAPSFVAKWCESVDGSGFIYAHEGKIPQEQILGVVDYAGRKLGINHMVIDSLTMCGIGRENYDAQADFVNQVRALAKRHSMHVHLVAHCRKHDDENKPVGKFDIRGAGEISDIADKVFVVQRNKRREEHIMLMENNQEWNQKYIDQHSTYVRLDKNRQGGKEGRFGFYFHEDSGQFTSQEDRVMNLGVA